MNILKIQQYDINNGDGVRVSIWTAGCSHHCKGCWSKDTWNPNQGKPLTEALPEIEKAILNSNIDGVSILGGDPLYDVMEMGSDKDLVALLNLCKHHKKNVWLWTGYKYEEIPAYIRDMCDVIIDGVFVESLKDLNLKHRGSSNQRIIKKKCN